MVRKIMTKFMKQKRTSMRTASEQYGVPYTTISEHQKYGRPQALNEQNERQLVEALQVSAE